MTREPLKSVTYVNFVCILNTQKMANLLLFASYSCLRHLCSWKSKKD